MQAFVLFALQTVPLVIIKILVLLLNLKLVTFLSKSMGLHIQQSAIQTVFHVQAKTPQYVQPVSPDSRFPPTTSAPPVPLNARLAQAPHPPAHHATQTHSLTQQKTLVTNVPLLQTVSPATKQI